VAVSHVKRLERLLAARLPRALCFAGKGTLCRPFTQGTCGKLSLLCLSFFSLAGLLHTTSIPNLQTPVFSVIPWWNYLTRSALPSKKTFRLCKRNGSSTFSSLVALGGLLLSCLVRLGCVSVLWELGAAAVARIAMPAFRELT